MFEVREQFIDKLSKIISPAKLVELLENKTTKSVRRRNLLSEIKIK